MTTFEFSPQAELELTDALTALIPDDIREEGEACVGYVSIDHGRYAILVFGWCTHGEGWGDTPEEAVKAALEDLLKEVSSVKTEP